MAITTDPEFKDAVDLAKSLALAQGKSELSVSLLLGGFKLLLSNEQKAKSLSEGLRKRRVAISDSCRLLNIPGDINPEKGRSVKLPISKILKDLLANKEKTIEAFVDSLIKSNVLVSREDDEAFERVLLRASSWLRRQGSPASVEPELLGVAAYVCYMEGDFQDKPHLATHILLSRKPILALMASRNWNLLDFELDGGGSVELSKACLESLDENETSRILAAVDKAIDQGWGLLGERQTAIHESGHAVSSFLLRPQIPISQVSIIGVDDYAGKTAYDWTSISRKEDSRDFFSVELQVLLAGGIAEQIAYGMGAIDSGARSDIETATKYVWLSVAYFGLDEEFGPISIQALAEEKGYTSGYFSDAAQKRCQFLLKKARDDVRVLLEKNWNYVEEMANLLVECKAIGTQEIIEVFIDKGLANWPGVLSVESQVTEREVMFASESGICETLEGPVRYDKGDAIVTGENGEQWPISIEEFERRYRPLSKGKFGLSGRFQKASRKALAIQLTTAKSIILSGSRGVLEGRVGDWVVDYGGGDLSVVQNNLFESYYRPIKGHLP